MSDPNNTEEYIKFAEWAVSNDFILYLSVFGLGSTKARNEVAA